MHVGRKCHKSLWMINHHGRTPQVMPQRSTKHTFSLWLLWLLWRSLFVSCRLLALHAISQVLYQWQLNAPGAVTEALIQHFGRTVAARHQQSALLSVSDKSSRPACAITRLLEPTRQWWSLLTKASRPSNLQPQAAHSHKQFEHCSQSCDFSILMHLSLW